MSFEQFHGKYRSHHGKCYASITKFGVIVFSVGAQHTFQLKQFSAVRLSYEKETRRIGLHFRVTKEYESSVYTITRAANGASLRISVTGFLKLHDIIYTKLKRYALFWDKEEELYIINLKNPYRTAKKRVTNSKDVNVVEGGIQP